MKEETPGDSVGAYEAKTHLSELLERVGHGEEITITKHGSPVARLVPVKMKSTLAERRHAINRWIKSARAQPLGSLTIRELIDEGRT